MTKLDSTWRRQLDDKLVIEYRHTITGQRVRQGKRVAKTCPLTRTERAIYVKEGSIPCIKNLMLRRGIDLLEAKRLFDTARGQVFHHYTGA